jgi:hypothetical protein
VVLVSQKRKGKGKVSNKKSNSEVETSQSGKKKELSKFKCFVCHKSANYASQCLEKEKAKGKLKKVEASVETQLNEFPMKLESEFSLVSYLSYLSTSTVARSVWYLGNGASHHMT